MNELFSKVITWIKGNILIAALIAIAVVILLFPKLLRGLFGSRRVRHRRKLVVSTRRRRSLPRSVGIKRRNKPAQYNKSGSRKKAWQIKGSLAAKRHMAQIRRMR